MGDISEKVLEADAALRGTDGQFDRKHATFHRAVIERTMYKAQPQPDEITPSGGTFFSRLLRQGTSPDPPDRSPAPDCPYLDPGCHHEEKANQVLRGVIALPKPWAQAISEPQGKRSASLDGYPRLLLTGPLKPGSIAI